MTRRKSRVREFELIYVIQPDATSEREQEIHGRADTVIEGAGSRVLLREDWGKRKLAYEIKSFQKGHYFQLNFLGNGSEVAELERSLRIDQDVLRFLSIQVSDDVVDVEARVKEATEQAEEQARRREERARIEAERELEREQERARMEAERAEASAAAGEPEATKESAGEGSDQAGDSSADRDADESPPSAAPSDATESEAPETTERGE